MNTNWFNGCVFEWSFFNLQQLINKYAILRNECVLFLLLCWQRYDVARRLLVTAEAEVSHHGGMMKLAQLIAWEIFLVESHSIHVDWPDKNTGTNSTQQQLFTS